MRSVVFSLGHNLSHGNEYFEHFYKQLKARGKHTHAAYIAVGNKFIKVAYAMLQKRRPFLPPLWKGEPLAKLVAESIKSPEYAESAQKKLQQLLALPLRIVC